jgi:hypothetical protein
MKTSKNILISTYSEIDISILGYLNICNFQRFLKKMFFLVSFLLAFISFSQTNNFHLSTDSQFSGLEQLYLIEIKEISKETLQIKTTNISGTFFVHSSTELYIQRNEKIKVVYIDSLNETKAFYKQKKNKSLVVTPKKTNKLTKIFVSSHNPSSGASGVIAKSAFIITVPTYKKNKTSTAVAIHLVPYGKVLKKQNQATNYQKNTRAYSLPIEYSNRPPPC